MALRNSKMAPVRSALTAKVLALTAFFLSGTAALVAQVCWIRRASLAFGSTVEALSTVLAVLFLGLATGSLVFGERSRHIERPLRTHAFLELTLALLVIATLPLFDVAESLYGHVYRASGTPGATVHAFRVLLVALVLLPPGVLMGGTLPLFCRQFVDRPERVGGIVALLYGVNTLGAAMGAALCGFVLLPSFGTQRALLIGAVLEFVAAVLGTIAGWGRSALRAGASTRAGQRSPRVEAISPRATAIVTLLFFCTGFVALGNEVLWTRFLALVERTTVLTYTICLTIVLSGIVAGSWLAGPMSDSEVPRARVFGGLQIAIGLGVLGSLLLPPSVWSTTGQWWGYLLVLLPPAVLSGAAFPLAVRMVVAEPGLVGAGVGRMTAVNTLGGIAGSLVVGFVALPRFGLHASALFTTGLALANGCAAWWFLDRRTGWRLHALAIGVCILVWVLLPRIVDTRLPQDFLADRSALVDYREGRESNLAVVRRQGSLVLEADRWWQGQDRKTHQVLAAHVPLLLHPAPRRVLIVGVGAGQTPARVLLYDVDRLDCVDIEPAVFDLVHAHFAGDWMEDPRVHLLREDGRSYVAHTGAQYDVIALELGQLFRPGVANFYSAEFYRQVRARLTPGGIASQFVPLPFLSPETFCSLVATFVDVFPQSVLWYNTAELLLLGVNADHFSVPVDRLDLLTANPGVRNDLGYSSWGGPAYWLNRTPVFLGGFLVGPSGLAALAVGAPIEHDDRPALAYASRDASELDGQELPIVDLLRDHLEPLGDVLAGSVADDTLKAAARVRERNLQDIRASALLRRVDTLTARNAYTALAGLLEEAQRANPENVQAQRLAGDLALYTGHAAEAQAAYARALALDPEDARSHLGLARSLQLQKRPAEAVAHYRAWLAHSPDDAEAHNNLAAALVAQGDLEGAQHHFEMAVQLRPEFAEAQENLARVRGAQRTRGE